MRVHTTPWSFVAAAIFLAIAAGARAYDWTDADCTQWDGTPQYRECLQAHEQLAGSTCDRWVKGEKEWVKCRHAHNVARAQKCQRAGEALRGWARARGYDGIATVECPASEPAKEKDAWR